MNRKQRRAETKQFEARMFRMQEEGQGVWKLSFFLQGNMTETVDAALNGDLAAKRIIMAITQCIQQIEDATTDRPVKCLACENTFSFKTLPPVFVMMEPLRDNAREVMMNGICLHCCNRHPSMTALQAHVLDLYREKLLPDMQVLPPFSEPGHA